MQYPDITPIIPEIILISAALSLLLLDLFIKRKETVGFLAIIGVSAAMCSMYFVDGIVGMDGNGPIQGEPRPAGVVVMGVDHVAVDATCCRLMTIAPERVEYLERASMFLGNLTTDRIDQRAEHVAGHETVFRLIDDFAGLRTVPAASPG